MNLINIDDKKKRFLLHTSNSSYAMQVNSDGFLINLHWGGQVRRLEDFPDSETLQKYRHCQHRRAMVSRQEYPAWGGEFYGEPALKVDLHDGVRSCILMYREYTTERKNDSEELSITLYDSESKLKVILHYRVYADSEIMERWSEISNEESQTVVLQNVMSANFNMPRVEDDYRLSHLAGRWGKESSIERQAVNQSKITLESRTGLSGPFAVPFFALDSGRASEHEGRVWFGTLLYSGNWKITVERDAYEQVSVSGGINDFDFSWPLKAGETFTTPIFCSGMSEAGFGETSRIIHRYQRQHLAPKEQIKHLMPLLFNSWASMGIEVAEEKILTIAEKAAAVGAELFVIDDGWQAALGDWFPDPKKFPHGLKTITDKVKKLGMDFGLWVEVESFEINSSLYREHPDWALTFCKRKPYCNYRDDIDRTSLMLNFAREDVAEYIYKSLFELIKTSGIKYLKLDMNCFVTSPGWDSVPTTEHQMLWVKYARNIHKVFGQLHHDFPHVLLENCAAGAGRADLTMDQYFGRMNRSDNQDTLDILKLHEGFTWMHTSRMAGGACHISDAVYGVNNRHIPMRFQAFAGMMGSLAIGKNLLKCSESDLNALKHYGELYKKFRHIPQFGELYRLASHYEHPYAAFEYVSQDKTEALLFIFGHSMQFGHKVPALKLQGLAPLAIYQIESIDDETLNIEDNKLMSGEGLKEVGIKVELLGDYDAKILYFKAINN